MPRERKGSAKFREAAEGDVNGPHVEGPNRPTASPARKKRKGSASSKVQASPSLPELIPPQPNQVRSHTIVAGNPFDDQPPTLTPLTGNMQQTMPNKPPHQSPTGHPNTGKVYPPNQPMVFNASNPNAPPINPCGTCHKEVHENDQAIFCESGCNFWFHRMCTGLTEMAYTMLTAEVYAEWVCDKCLSSKNIPLVKMKP